MNIFKNVLKVGVIALLLWSTASSVSAKNNDYIDWKNDFIIYTDYDKADEELTIKLGVDVSGPTDSDYSIEFDIGDGTCNTDLDFTYSAYKVQGECVVSVKEEDMRGVFTVDTVIKDDDGDADYDKEIQFEVDGYGDDFNWKDLDISATYNAEKQDLDIIIKLEDVTREPDKDYSIDLEIINRKLSEDMKYDSSEETLTAEFSTGVKESDAEDEYKLDFEIISEDINDKEEKEYDYRNDIEVEKLKTEDDFDWGDLDVSSLYDEDKQRLEVFLSLPGVKEKPLRRYTADIDVNEKEYDERLDWNSDTDELKASISLRIKEDDLRDDYNIDIQVSDDKSKRVHKKDYDVDVDIKRTEDKFDWDSIFINATYYEEEEELELEYVLPKIKQKPLSLYTLDLEIDNDDYEKVFSYSGNDDRLTSIIVIDIDQEDIESDYEISSLIRDEDKDKMYEEDATLKVKKQDSRKASEAVSTESGEAKVAITATYDRDRELLQIEVAMIEVLSEPKSDYTAELTAAGKTQVRTLKYLAKKQELSYLFSVYTTSDNLREQYPIYLIVRDGKNDVAYTTRETITRGETSTNTQSKPSTNNTSSSDSKVNKVVDNFIKKVENKYKTLKERKEYLEYVMSALDEIAAKKTKYKTVVKQINARIQTRLDFYQDVLSELNLD